MEAGSVRPEDIDAPPRLLIEGNRPRNAQAAAKIGATTCLAPRLSKRTRQG